MTGAEFVAEVSEQLARAPLDTRVILTTVTTTLSKLRSGTWIAVLMNKNPTTSAIVVTDRADPDTASYIERYLAAMSRPGETPTIGLSQRVIETGAPVLMPKASRTMLIDTVATQPARAFLDNEPPPLIVENIGVMVVPMRVQGAIIGTIGLFDWRRDSALTEADVQWLQAVADRTGLALEHAQLYRSAIDRSERVNALRSVLLAIGSSQDLRLTLEVIIEQLTSKLKADAADILILDEKKTDLVVATSIGFHSASIPNYRLRVDPRLMDPAILRRRGEVMTDPARIGHDQRLSLFAREGFQSYIAIPLVSRNELQGVLEVFHRSHLEPDQEWLDFMDAMANAAAIAISHAAVQRRVHLENLTDKSRKRPSTALDVSPLEQQILALMVEGRTNRDISAAVHLSQNTIKFHVRQILQKAGVANRTELAHQATRQGWL
jgi:GAF domain-containing protein